MTKTEIQENLTLLAQNTDNESFIYNLLLAYGMGKTTVSRLKNGDYNLSKQLGEVHYKGKFFFKEAATEHLMATIDELAKNEKIQRQKTRLLIVTDYKTILAVDTKRKDNKTFAFDDLPQQVDFFYPLVGGEIYRITTDNKADREAAYQMGQLFDLLATDNPDWKKKNAHHANLFLSRLLFCFFAEDTGIFPTKHSFTEALAHNTDSNGTATHTFLAQLFAKLNTPAGKGHFAPHFAHFPYVNGGLFADEIACPQFNRKTHQMLLALGELDWAEINPDIFGSMIQAVADPTERTSLGMHYTSVQNIHKLIKPLFLDNLYQEFEKNRQNPRNLEKLLVRMGKIKFFDPACGSGNFLIITYKELRLLEVLIIKQLIELGNATRSIYFTEISIEQFYGIELKDFAHEMAILSLWLAQHQMNQFFETELQDFGQSKPLLPLKQAGHIAHGNAARLDWETVCPKKPDDEIYIIGNPPYLGSNLHSDEQREEMQRIFNEKNLDRLDYIGTWFMLGAKYIQNSNAKCAFVSTNSITQGVQVPFLWKRVFERNVFIQFAVKSFKWTNNARGNAGVSVIIIGLSAKESDKILLYDNEVKDTVKSISPYLIKDTNVIVEPASQPQKGLPSLVMGNKPADDGNLILSKADVDKIISEYPASKKFIKKFISADDFINGNYRHCLWIGPNEEQEAKSIPFIKQRTENLRFFREKSAAKSTRDFAKNDYCFRQISYKASDGIVVPRVSSEKRPYIPLAYIDGDTIVSDATNIIYDAQPWLFGILHSKMHMVWVDAVGGKLKTDYRYSAKLCYNTFPFPQITAQQKESLTQYVFDILDQRALHPEKTMAWLYNPETMPHGLKQAHAALDLGVDRIYRLQPFANNAERLEMLFKLYEEMTKKDTLFAKVKKGKGK